MPKKTQIVIKESYNELDKALRANRGTRRAVRIKVLKILKSKNYKSHDWIASKLGIGSRSIERWIATYAKEGLSGLCKEETRQKPSVKITPQMHRELEKLVTDPSSPLLGYQDAVRYLEMTFNKKVNYHTLRNYLRKHFGTKLKVPRKSHYRKDNEAVQAFLKTT